VACPRRWNQWRLLRRRRWLADPTTFVTADLSGACLYCRSSEEACGFLEAFAPRFPWCSCLLTFFSLFGFAYQKTLGGGVSSGGLGPAPKQRPSMSPAPSTTPPQPPPSKISKSPSFIQEEIEVAEVLFGLTRQFPCPQKQESNHKLEPRDAPEAKSGNSSPAPSSSGVRPSDSTSLSTIGA
jgi:hypothetical protein